MNFLVDEEDVVGIVFTYCKWVARMNQALKVLKIYLGGPAVAESERKKNKNIVYNYIGMYIFLDSN